MGRKRKTRWRRLSIGEVSATEEEEHDKEAENLTGKINSGHRHRSGSQPSMLSSSSASTQPTTPTAMSSANKLPADPAPADEGYAGQKDGPVHSSYHNHHHYNGHHSDHSYHPRHHYPAYHHNKDGPSHHNNHHYSAYNGKDGGHQNGHYQGSNGYYSNNYYHHRNSYNNYRNSHYEGGERGYRGGSSGGAEYGSGDYNYHSSRYAGGRFRKPRPYSSNYYYNNGTGHQSAGTEDTPATNKPSYNQDEYTKITTPRQDVLFKKGYLSQRKAVVQSSSVDSTSGPTTPSASTNGTPDTNNSTNGINSDYSEGYENGETDCGVPPYDETVYYGTPAEAVFTDPNTGQVYYGQCSSNGEYFDAYPVSPMMMAGYPTPVYYHLPYPGMDWNGLPTTMYHPIVAQPQLEEHQQLFTPGSQGAEPQNQTNGIKTHAESPPKILMMNGAETGSDELSDLSPKHNLRENVRDEAGTAEAKETCGQNGGGHSSASSTSSSLSSSASTPLSPPANGGMLLQQLPASMAALSLGGPPQAVHHPVPHFIAAVPQPSHHGPPAAHPFMYHPHPSGFVYAPPIYNGVVVPIAPAASTAESSSLEISASSSRKKRKKRRRKKDGQLTDESSDESTGLIEGSDTQSSPPFSKESSPLNTQANCKANQLQSSSTSSGTATPASESPSPTKAQAVKKDLLSEEVTKPEETPVKLNCEVSVLEPESVPVQYAAKGPEGDSQNPNPSQAPEEAPETIDTVKPEDDSSVVEPEPVSSTSAVKLGKKPADLSVFLEPADLSLLSLQRSPDALEPSSPDSLNTNQSVAGSEVASVSVSETDFMNRTTSVDEVEEDLPDEDETPGRPCESESEKSPEHKQNASYQPSDLSTLKNQDTSLLERGPSSPALPESGDSSTRSTPDKSLERSPSLEEIFERQLELPDLPEPNEETNVPAQPFSTLISRESTLESLNIPETVTPVESQPEQYEIAIESLERPDFTNEAVLTVLTPPTIETDPPPEIEVQEPDPEPIGAEPEPEFQVPEQSPTLDFSARPNSITLAVSEWLKTQGEDALTPVAQLQAQFEEAADGDAEESDSEDDSESLTADDLTQSEQNPKNVQGNPWAAPSSKSGCRLSRKAPGLKRLRTTGRSGAPMDGTTCSRVACASPPNPKTNINSKSEGHVHLPSQTITDEDSGIEISSVESTPIKTVCKVKRRSEEREMADKVKRRSEEREITDKVRRRSPEKESVNAINPGLEEKEFGAKVGFDLESPVTPRSSVDEGNSAETCDPLKFAKYYQLGVVFEPDQGIDLSLDSNLMTTCDLSEDEEVGTFDPESLPKGRHMMTETETEPERFPDPDEYIDDDDCVQGGKSLPHLYVNPFSLAQELMITTRDTGATLPESWDVDSTDGLPQYESPSPPVFNSFTPRSNVIRAQLQSNGGPVLPRGICCAIQ